jgi:hypothetical protein
MAIVTVGIDLAKSGFGVSGVDATGLLRHAFPASAGRP